LVSCGCEVLEDAAAFKIKKDDLNYSKNIIDNDRMFAYTPFKLFWPEYGYKGAGRQ
jgi:hypothetical protein